MDHRFQKSDRTLPLHLLRQLSGSDFCTGPAWASLCTTQLEFRPRRTMRLRTAFGPAALLHPGLLPCRRKGLNPQPQQTSVFKGSISALAC
jgi:hypothetical protein